MSPGTSEPPVPEALSAGDVIADKYRIDSVLAEGGMGIVYRGWHLALELPVAIKVIRPELAPRPDFAMRFLNEARSAARLRGQHIARVLDIGSLGDSFGGALYMVMELLDGSDLRSILERDGPLPPERAIRYALGACDALAEVHAAGIVHRDVKPDNLFLAQDARDSEVMKLLDFGISKSFQGDPGYQTREGLGSPLYVAPEQLSNSENVDARADIWSLGVVLYELLSGRVPFEGDNVVRICSAVMELEPEPLWHSCPHVSPALEAVVRRCLSKRPEARFPTIRELSLALRALQPVEALDASAPVFGARPGRPDPGPRHRARQLERARATGRQERAVRARSPSWRRQLALGAAAAALASGIPVSTLVDAVAARGSAHPATVPATDPSQEVEMPPRIQSGPVVCPVQVVRASDPERDSPQRDGAAQTAVHATRAPVSIARRSPSASGTGVSVAARATPPSRSESVTAPASAYRLIQPYGMEPEQDTEAEPHEASGRIALDLADLGSGMLRPVYGHLGR
jgi:hypothetical protein